MSKVEGIYCECDHSAVKNICSVKQFPVMSADEKKFDEPKYSSFEITLPFHPPASSMVRYTALDSL